MTPLSTVTFKSAISLAAVFVTALAPIVCRASVYSARIRPLQLAPTARDYSRGLDGSAIQPIHSLRTLTSQDVQKMIPTDLDPAASPSRITARILDQSLKNAMSSEAVKHSSFGRTAASVQRSMQTNVTIANREPNSIQHQFKIAMQPVQSQALLHYSGLTDAQLTYRANDATAIFEMRESVKALSTDVVYNHVNVPGERKDLMSLRWVW